MTPESSIQLIVGLGNPGEKYRATPHNLGRCLIEVIAKNRRLKWIQEKQFDRTESVPSYVKLNTYMNVSGSAVREIIQEFRCRPAQVLVCCDDFDLPLGTIRLRKKGSAGSHNGLKSVIEYLETKEFPRLRLGIGPLPRTEDPAEFVLKPFWKGNEKVLTQMMAKAAEAVEVLSSESLESAMNRFNRVDI